MFSGYGSPLITSNLRITRANWLTRLTDLANSGFGGETLPQRKWNNIPNINLEPPKPIYIHKNIHPHRHYKCASKEKKKYLYCPI